MAPPAPTVSRQDRAGTCARLSADCMCNSYTTGETITTLIVESRFLFSTVKPTKGE